MKNKQDIREYAKTYYQEQTTAERAALMQEMVKKITTLPMWQQAHKIALTLAQSNELPTQLLIQTALLQKKEVYLPRVAPQQQLDFVAIDEATEYETHKFGMLEPLGPILADVNDLDLILVPGLAFSAAGQRIGFGGGYYDRLLAKYPQITTVGVVSRPFYLDTANWEVQAFDQPVSQVVVLGGENE